MVFEDGDVAVASVVIPVEAREAVGRDEEGFNTVGGDAEGAVGVDGNIGGHSGD